MWFDSQLNVGEWFKLPTTELNTRNSYLLNSHSVIDNSTSPYTKLGEGMAVLPLLNPPIELVAPFCSKTQMLGERHPQLLILGSLKDPLFKNDILNSVFPALRRPMSPIESGCFENCNDTWHASNKRLRSQHLSNTAAFNTIHYVSKKHPSKLPTTQLMKYLFNYNSPFNPELMSIYIVDRLEEAPADNNILSGKRRTDTQSRHRIKGMDHRQSAPNYPLLVNNYNEIPDFGKKQPNSLRRREIT